MNLGKPLARITTRAAGTGPWCGMRFKKWNSFAVTPLTFCDMNFHSEGCLVCAAILEVLPRAGRGERFDRRARLQLHAYKLLQLGAGAVPIWWLQSAGHALQRFWNQGLCSPSPARGWWDWRASVPAPNLAGIANYSFWIQFSLQWAKLDLEVGHSKSKVPKWMKTNSTVNSWFKLPNQVGILKQRHLCQIPLIYLLFLKEKKASNVHIANVDFLFHAKRPRILTENGGEHLFACQNSDIECFNKKYL